MSIFDFLKAKWSGHAMTQEDRRKLFWYLMRKTSYTAWRRQSDAFDQFASIFERQVREEPVATTSSGYLSTKWEWLYPDVLKAQVLYEHGLANLAKGDRTVWLYNERGILDDADTEAGKWYTDLVNHGMRGDHFFDGKYLDELTEAIKQFGLTCQVTAAIIQPMMAETPAPEFWSGFFHDQFAQLVLPNPLPEVPSPSTETLVRTGEIAPVFGIYEPQVKDGCMNYLLGGVPAPTIWESGGTYSTCRKIPVIWRLIWEDSRYLDGKLPREEADYFPNDGATGMPTTVSPPIEDNLLSISTCEICPRSGEWAVMDELHATAVLREGQKTPQHTGRDVNWVWLRK